MKMRVLLVAALALLAGCGGSGGDATGKDDGSAGNTMSAAAWSKRVEALCVQSEANATKAGRQLGRRAAAAGDSKQELTYKILQLESKLIGPWMDRVEALPKPKGREQDASRFVAGMRDVGDVLGQAATAIKQNDATSAKKLAKQLAAKTVSLRSQARALDIEKCNPSPNGSSQ